jgi:iron complex outermembrane receptor protein
MFYDLENVQVLKGPQGTLFGRNTTGGAILFEPHRPEWKNGGYAEVTLGDYDLKKFSGMVNIQPVPDVLAMRFAGEVMRRDGFTQSIITGQKQDDRNYESFRGSILFTPSADVENLTIVDYRSRHNNGVGMVIRALNPDVNFGSIPVPPIVQQVLSFVLGTPVTATSLPLNAGTNGASIACLTPINLAVTPTCPAPIFGSGALGAYGAAVQGGGFYLIAPSSQYQQILDTQAQIGPRKNQNNYLGLSDEDTIGIVNKTKIILSDDLTLKNILGYRKTRSNEVYNFTGTPLPLLIATGPWTKDNRWTWGTQQFTEELQLQGNVPSANFNYILGGYYEHLEPGFDQGQSGVTANSITHRTYVYNDTGKALYAHAEWNPVELVNLAGGIRKNWDKRAVTQSAYDVNYNCNQVDGTGAIACPIANEAKFQAWTYDATLSLKPTHGVLVYGAFRHGYKSGGLNVPFVPADPPLPLDYYATYQPETVNDFEIGAKLDFNVGSVPVRLNMAGFYDKYNNQQLSVQVPFIQPDGTPYFTSQIQSIGKSTIKGFEGELSVQPFKLLQLNGFVSYLEATPDEDVVNPATGELVTIGGRQLPNQPKWKYGLSGVLTLPVDESAGDIALSADYAWQDSFNGSPLPALVTPSVDSYGVLNMRLSWNSVAQSKFDVALFVTNVTDKTYVAGATPITQLGLDSVYYGEPRMWGASVKFHFGE